MSAQTVEKVEHTADAPLPASAPATPPLAPASQPTPRAGVRARSIRAIRRHNRALTNAMGTLAVLICLAIPIALGIMTWQIDNRNTDTYLRNARATATQVTAGAPAVSAPLQPNDMRANHYYFISGCVSNPGDCGKAHGGSWGEYYLTLHAIYDQVATEARTPGGLSWPAFDTWASEHSHFLSTQTATDGTLALDKSLREIETNGEVHLIGTSAGGSVILAYFSRAMAARLQLDPRIASAVMVDAPLGFQFPMQSGDVGPGLEAGLIKSEVHARIGEWLNIWGIPLLTVDTPYDIIGHDPVPGVPYDAAPVYGGDTPPRPVADADCQSPLCQTANFFETITVRNTWHNYTGGHIPGSVAEFMREHWR
jgi:pimeloyl-ACP methyl ester carboxylesterase